MSIASRQADAKNRADEAIFWVIEKVGNPHQVFGPYTLSQARRECGTRYTVIRGSDLRNGDTIPSGHLIAAVSSGRIWTIDGEDLS